MQRRIVSGTMLLLHLACMLVVSLSEALIIESSTTVYLDPSTISGQLGETVNVNIMVSNVQNLWAWQARLIWDSNMLEYVSYTTGEFSALSETVFFPGLQDIYGSFVEAAAGKWGKAVSAGILRLLTITFRVIGSGTCQLRLQDVSLRGRDPVRTTSYARWSDICGNETVWWTLIPDGYVDIFDIVSVVKAYGAPSWWWSVLPQVDLDGNGMVDLTDLAIVTSDYGKTNADAQWGVTNTIYDIPVIVTPTSSKRLDVKLWGQGGSWSWAWDQLGECPGTYMRDYGCAVTSIAMVFKYYGVETDPGELNEWLNKSGIYESGCEMGDKSWSTAAELPKLFEWIPMLEYWGPFYNEAAYDGSKGPKVSPEEFFEKIRMEINDGNPVIVNVKRSGVLHFFVITGYSEDGTYFINDPEDNGIQTTINEKYGNPENTIRSARGYKGNPLILWILQNLGFIIEVKCPVGIVLTDPDGLTVSKELTEIEIAAYLEDNITDRICIGDPKSGCYLITVVPETGASPTDTYSLRVFGENISFTLAEDVLISEIPSQPYRISSTDTGITFRTDLNQDRKVNIIDISTVAMAFGTKEGDDRYNPIADLDDNKEINIIDVAIVANDYGKTM